MRCRFVIEADADDPQGMKEALAMAAERFGSGRVVEVEPLEEQASMDGVLGARAQLEAALERRQP